MRKRRQADLRDRHAERRDDAERVQIGGLALVGGHAGGGVALDVLDRAEALAHASASRGGDVVLPIDEGLAAPARSPRAARRA
jgi:hypothetical protein